MLFCFKNERLSCKANYCLILHFGKKGNGYFLCKCKIMRTINFQIVLIGKYNLKYEKSNINAGFF